jgi:hypothetical protein
MARPILIAAILGLPAFPVLAGNHPWNDPGDMPVGCFAADFSAALPQENTPLGVAAIRLTFHEGEEEGPPTFDIRVRLTDTGPVRTEVMAGKVLTQSGFCSVGPLGRHCLVPGRCVPSRLSNGSMEIWFREGQPLSVSFLDFVLWEHGGCDSILSLGEGMDRWVRIELQLASDSVCREA